MSYISCKPTARPYMLIKIRAGVGAWKTLETVKVDEQMLKRMESASPGTRILDVRFYNEGTIKIWKDETNPVGSELHWRKGEQRIRAIANLRSGGVDEVNFNASGYSGTKPPGTNGYRGMEYMKQSNGTSVMISGGKSIDVKDVASFDLQAQDLKPVVSLVVHSPMSGVRPAPR